MPENVQKTAFQSAHEQCIESFQNWKVRTKLVHVLQGMSEGRWGISFDMAVLLKYTNFVSSLCSNEVEFE
jgi:hypothetical protein